jgi:GxxExxY protein
VHRHAYNSSHPRWLGKGGASTPQSLSYYTADKNQKLHEEIIKDIIGAAMAVLNELKPGLDEKLYDDALVIELKKHRHTDKQQRPFPVHYKGEPIGTLILDLTINNKVITDPKVISAFNDTHIAQMLGYLNITGLSVA